MMSKLDLKKMVDAAGEFLNDMYSDNLKSFVELAVAKLDSHGRPQILNDLICSFWGVSICKKVNDYMYQYFDLKKKFEEMDFVSKYDTVIGSLKCCNYSVNVIYSEDKKIFCFDDGTYISEDVEGLFKYMISDRSILPITILPDTFRLIENAGWYNGREVDISDLIEKYKSEMMKLSEKQIHFFKEFGGLTGRTISNMTYEICINPRYSRCVKKVPITKENLSSFNNLNIISNKENVNFILAGFVDDSVFWISSDGRIFTDQGVQMGRTLMEALQFIVLS